MPPDFWARAASPAHSATASTPAVASARKFPISLFLHEALRARPPPGDDGRSGVSVAYFRRAPTGSVGEPQILEARTVVDAVHHADQTLDAWPPAGDAAHVQDVQARIFFDQLPFDLPDQLPPLVGVDFL